MSFISPETQSMLSLRLSWNKESICNNLHFVISVFDEISGPKTLFNNSMLDKEILEKLNFKIFSFMMQGLDFGPNNSSKLRGIIQIPKTEYYTSVIDIIVKKRNEFNQITFVPLVIFLIFPKKDLIIYAQIANNIENYISKRFKSGFNEIPSFSTLQKLISRFYLKILESN